MTRVRTLVASLATIAASAVVFVAAPAQAVVVEPPRPAFYEAPATLPAANGTVIRSETMSFLLDPANATSLVTNAKRVLYKTTNRSGRAIAVSGVVMVPKTAWVGIGSRPVIGFAAGTQGMGDRCAPSRQYSEGFEYEGFAIQGLLARGYAVALTDYEGLGTAGIHTYMDRVSQGRAVLDVIRAAQRLPGTGLSATSPVGIEGYSQGGGAAASAGELASTYAPELKLKGVAVGAVPADLKQVASTLDGGLYSAFAFFALRGISASYGVDLSPYLNAKGVETMTTVEQDCVFDLFGHSFVKSSTLSYNGKPMSDLIAQAPVRRDDRRPEDRQHQADGAGVREPLRPRRRHPLRRGQGDGEVLVQQGCQRADVDQRDPHARGRLRAVRRGVGAVLRGAASPVCPSSATAG